MLSRQNRNRKCYFKNFLQSPEISDKFDKMHKYKKFNGELNHIKLASLLQVCVEIFLDLRS